MVAVVVQRGRRDLAAGQAPDDRGGRLHAGEAGRGAGHRQRPAVVADGVGAVTGGVDVRVRDRAHGAVDDDLAVCGRPPARWRRRWGARRTRPSTRSRRRQARCRRRRAPAPPRRLRRVVCSWTVMPSRSKARRRCRRASGRARRPARRGGERDRQAGPGLGDLGGGLDRGQVVADDQHVAALAQVVQALAQTQRRGRPATSKACSATPGTPWSATGLPSA